MPRIRLTLEYDGTRLRGLAATAQRAQRAGGAGDRARRAAGWTGADGGRRTDRRRGACAGAGGGLRCTARRCRRRRTSAGSRRLLPPDMAVVAAEEVPEGFDPRRWATGKRYRYLVSQPARAGRRCCAGRTGRSSPPLDVDEMRAAAAALLGTHDFSSFRAADCAGVARPPHAPRADAGARRARCCASRWRARRSSSTWCGTSSARWSRSGEGSAAPEWVGEVLAARDRTLAGPTAPAHGLTLVSVSYGDGPRPRSQGAGT